MKRLPKKLLAALAEWTDRSVEPDAGDDGNDAYWDAQMELGSAFDPADFEGASLTPAQRRAGAMINYSMGVAGDGLVIGVLVNQPEILPHVVEAARACGLEASRNFLEQLTPLVPKELAEMEFDDRIEWVNEHESECEAIEELEQSDEGETARLEMQLAAMRILVEHPGEFFGT